MFLKNLVYDKKTRSNGETEFFSFQSCHPEQSEGSYEIRGDSSVASLSQSDNQQNSVAPLLRVNIHPHSASPSSPVKGEVFSFETGLPSRSPDKGEGWRAREDSNPATF
jgi:hypothetical protein